MPQMLYPGERAPGNHWIGGWVDPMASLDQWRLVAKISGGAAPENCIFFINWGMATDIKLKDYVLYKYKERIKEKRIYYIICYR
jgi:hypothetical protein